MKTIKDKISFLLPWAAISTKSLLCRNTPFKFLSGVSN